MTRVLLDTEKGGYPCWGCGQSFDPDQAQLILGLEDEIRAVCLVCLATGEVALW